MRTPGLVPHRQPAAPAAEADAGRPHATPGMSALRHSLQRIRPLWPDIVWAAFVALNLAAMRLLPAWQTVPFLAIWVSLTVIYGFRLWRLQPTILTLAAVTLATGGIIFVQVLKGQQDADYLAEVPLIALMFLVMVWHGRRRLAATEERLTAMEQVQQISQENLRLLEQQRQFLQDQPAAAAGLRRDPGLPAGGAGGHRSPAAGRAGTLGSCAAPLAAGGSCRGHRAR